MDSKLGSAVSRSYEDFQPQVEWLREEGLDALLVYLPGFKKEQIKCQVVNQRNLKVSGERPIDTVRWSRFGCEFRIPKESVTSDIRARFEDGLLYVTLPKSLPPVVGLPQPVHPPPLTAPKPSPKLSPETKPSPKIPQVQKPSPKLSSEPKPSPMLPEPRRPSLKLSPDRKPSLKLPEEPEPSLKLPEERKPSLKLSEEPKPSPKPAVLKEEWTKTPPPNEATKEKNQTSAKQTDPKANEIYEDANSAALPGAGGVTGKGDWGGMGDVLMGLKERPRELVVNVMVAVMVVVGLGIYLAYKVMSRRKGTH